MKLLTQTLSLRNLLFVSVFAILVSGCAVPAAPPVPATATEVAEEPYMKMNPPADSDKPFPVPGCDNSCWIHNASNMLAAAGYGDGTSVQARARDIWDNMDPHYANGTDSDGNTCYPRGWPDTALTWWLNSTHNTWTDNPYTLPTVYGNKTMPPWSNPNGARDLANELRSCNPTGIAISWPVAGSTVGTGGHAITAWGDDIAQEDTLTTNPGLVWVTDSDRDTGGDRQGYNYDAYTNPNPNGPNEGNGWYIDYSNNHPYIRCITTLSPGNGKNSVRVKGSYLIQQTREETADGLHYRVGTDTDILSYRTWLDVRGNPIIEEDDPRYALTVDWELEEGVL